MDLGLILHGQCRKMGVRDEAGTDAGGTEISLEVCHVLSTGVDRLT